MRMVNPRTNHRIPLPVHGSRDIGVGVIRTIIRQLGISREEWNSL